MHHESNPSHIVGAIGAVAGNIAVTVSMDPKEAAAYLARCGACNIYHKGYVTGDTQDSPLDPYDDSCKYSLYTY